MLLNIAFIFVTIGFGIKAGIIPFHLWVPDTYDGAYYIVTIYLSTITKVGAFLMFIRIIPIFSGELSYIIGLIALSAITMTLGNIFAINQKNIIRMLANSSIANTGYILSSLIVVNSIDFNAAFFYLAVLVFMDLGAFLVGLFREKVKNVYLDDFNGIYKNSKFLSFVSTIFLLALMGIPFLSGFPAKLLILVSLIRNNMLWLGILFVLNSAISLGYYGSLVKRMYFEEPTRGGISFKLSVYEVLSLIIILLIVVFLGVYPQILYSSF